MSVTRSKRKSPAFFQETTPLILPKRHSLREEQKALLDEINEMKKAKGLEGCLENRISVLEEVLCSDIFTSIDSGPIHSLISHYFVNIESDMAHLEKQKAKVEEQLRVEAGSSYLYHPGGCSR